MNAAPLKAQLVIFDLDGTLVDSLRDIATAMNHALLQHGFPTHELDVYRRLVGEGIRQLSGQAVPEGHENAVPSVLAGYQAYYREHLIVHTVLYPGIASLLDALTQRGVARAILSNKPDRATQSLAAALLGQWSFLAISGERPPLPRKPDPQTALDICAKAGVRAQDTIFVGDSAIDMQTAHAAGMVACGVSWGFRGKDELLAAGADLLLSNPMELLDLFEPLDSPGPRASGYSG